MDAPSFASHAANCSAVGIQFCGATMDASDDGACDAPALAAPGAW